MSLLRGLAGNSPVTHNCPNCSAPVRCDVARGKSHCWCFGIQAKEQEHGDVCICAACLKHPEK